MFTLIFHITMQSIKRLACVSLASQLSVLFSPALAVEAAKWGRLYQMIFSSATDDLQNDPQTSLERILNDP